MCYKYLKRDLGLISAFLCFGECSTWSTYI